jgi:hypothetical protein
LRQNETGLAVRYNTVTSDCYTSYAYLLHVGCKDFPSPRLWGEGEPAPSARTPGSDTFIAPWRFPCNAFPVVVTRTISKLKRFCWYDTKVDAHAAIASYIHGFYNPTRLHSALGYLSPNSYATKLKHAA